MKADHFIQFIEFYRGYVYIRAFLPAWGRVTKEHGLDFYPQPTAAFGPERLSASWREGLSSALLHVSLAHSAVAFLSAYWAANSQLASFRYPWISARRDYPFKPSYSVFNSPFLAGVSSGVKQAVSLTVSSTRRLIGSTHANSA